MTRENSEKTWLEELLENYDPPIAISEQRDFSTTSLNTLPLGYRRLTVARPLIKLGPRSEGPIYSFYRPPDLDLS